MKEPWDTFTDLYLEAIRSKTHEMAVVHPFAEMLHDFANRRQLVPIDGIGRLKLAADRWHNEGSGDRLALRQSLRNAWTDWVLEQNRR